MKDNKNESFHLPVLRKVQEGKNEFYVVEYLGIEYKIKLYDFQKARPVPTTLLCHAVYLPDGVILTQDYSEFLSEFYKVGESYPFKVVSVHTANRPPYYKVRDKNGLSFRLIDYGMTRLHEHEDITCKVTNLDGYRLRLKLQMKKDSSLLPFFSVENLADAVEDKQLARYMRYSLKYSKDWEFIASSYRERRGEWVLRLLSFIEREFDPSVISDEKRLHRILKALTKLSLYLLEGSSYLKNLDDIKRRKTRDKLENYVRRFSTLSDAISIVREGRDIDEINIILSKMKNSGYLYNPEEKLALMIAIFTLRPDIVDQNMSIILEIITEGNHTNWMQEPFRSAFLRQLNFYVKLAKEKADRASYDDMKGRELLRKMIQALAIRSLMSDRYTDSDIQLDRAALFRYLTFENINIGLNLLDKAFLCVTDSIDSSVDYDWEDVTDLKRLSLKMAKGSESVKTAVTSQIFEGNTVALNIVGDKIHLSPLSHRKNIRPVLPSDMLPWHSIQIYADKKAPTVAEDERSLSKLHRFWHDMELYLQNPTSGLSDISIEKDETYPPEKGDVVDIVIDGLSPDGRNFACHTVDSHIVGSGFISLQNICRYVNWPQNPSIFRNENGQQYILRAEVINTYGPDTAEFSLMPCISEYLDGLEYNYQMECMVLTSVPNYRDKYGNIGKAYIGFSSEGDSVVAQFEGSDPQLSPGNFIRVSLNYINNRYSQAVCNIIESHVTPKEYFDRQKAFEEFILNYSHGNVVEIVEEDEEDEDEIQLTPMDSEYLRELIRIVDRVASMEKEQVKMFNYLSFCRLMALLLNDEELANYYSRRTEFLRSLETFVNSGYINLENLKIDEEGYMDYPEIRMRARQMRVLSYLDHPEKNDNLWDIIRTDDTETTVALAKLALLSNMSMEFKLSGEVRDRVNKEMSHLLKIEVKLPDLISFGEEESQELEFKSSYLYDQSFKYNPEKQAAHIMERICGFLNTRTGGSLYIGVNNHGFASGLEEDMKSLWFKGNGTRDKFDLKVRNDIRLMLGSVANDCITTEWIDAKGKDVYRIDIKPCAYPVKFNDCYWIRQGTSTYAHDFDAYNKIVTARRNNPEPAVPEEKSGEAPIATPEEPTSPISPEHTVVPATAAIQAAPSDERPSEGGNNTYFAGTLRSNSRNDWEENFIPSKFHINILDNFQYDITETTNWETDRYIAVHPEELEGDVALVYADGKAIRIPVADFANKEFDKRYARYKDEKLIFASVGMPTDTLMIVYDCGGKKTARIEPLSEIRQGSMTDTPEALTSGDFDSVVRCEIIPLSKTVKLKPLQNISRNKSGNGLSAPVLNALSNIGINL